MNIRTLIPFKKQLRFVKKRVKHFSYLRFPHNKGYCPICEKKVVFYKEDKWLRDYYKCNSCGSIPRNRALVNALNNFFPKWRESILHESSPGDPLSRFLKKSCANYSSSYYFEDV